MQLGNGFADLMAIEPNGRITVIEIKLARNAEARRAIIAQVLAYAAYLWGMDQRTLEDELLKALTEAYREAVGRTITIENVEG